MVGKTLVVVLAMTLSACATATAPEGFGGGGSDPDGGAGAPDGGGADGAGPEARCGDGVCAPGAGESCGSCPSDCGACGGCQAGTADCDGDPANGCETSLTSAEHCGGCGIQCLAAGGANPCVLAGAAYTCKPSCDATHGDCDGDATNGCETDLQSPDHCGTCDVVQVGSDPDHCGDCGRACSMANASARACAGGACTPACTPGFSDCSRPAAPAADDGCETKGSLDPGEPDNQCNGQTFDVSEGATDTRTTNRILPAGDLDTFTVNLREGSHVCLPLTSQTYGAVVTLTSPAGTPLQLGYNLSGSCNNSFTAATGPVCVNWSGTCSFTDDKTISLQVSGPGGANACGDYTLTVRYCGGTCPGC